MTDVKGDMLNNAEIPLRDIDFQVDTLQQNDDTWAAAYFSPDKNTITTNYMLGRDNSFNESDNVLLHEQKHRDNSAAGLYSYAVSPEQAYKLNMHDEISATMAELIYFREKYLETGDISVFDGKGSFFDFYKQAVEKGEIKPGSPYKEDFEKDMALIVNGTRDTWEKKYAGLYNDYSMWHAKYSSGRSGKFAEYYDQNYQRGMEIAYTIGGVDFTKYMDRDAEIPAIGKLDLKMLNDVDGKSNRVLSKEFDVPAFDGSMSLEQYQKLVQHKLVMQRFLDKVPPYYDKKNYIDMICLNQVALNSGEDLGSCKEYLDRVKGDFASAYGEIDKNVVNAFVNSAAKKYAARGDRLPEADDEAYNRAVDKIYTYPYKVQGDINFNGNINLRNSLCDENMLKTKLPEYAQTVQNRDWWKRGLNRWADFVGLSEEKKNHLNNQMENAGPLKKYGMGTLLYIGAPVASAIEKGMSWFDERKEEKVENKPLRALNAKAPQYREWQNKDGSRVSEVLYRTLPDFRQEVIKKPEMSYAEERPATRENGPRQTENADKTKITQIVEQMNKINGAGHAIDAAAMADVLYEKYGEQAYKLTLSAVSRPCDYAKFVNDASITTSRAALNHLSALEGKELQRVNDYGRTAGKDAVSVGIKNDQQAQPADSVRQVAQGMRRGHDRIAAMWAKVAAGHEADRTAMYREVLGGNDNTEVIRQLRSSKTISSGVVRPTAISADLLKKQLQELQIQP